MAEHPGQLPVPPVIQEDREATEVLRAWVANGGLTVSLKSSFEDPAVWGVLLVDLARHAARTYAAEGHREDDALQMIRAMLDQEWDRPTDLGETAALQ